MWELQGCTVTPAMLRLLAYCGDAEAREALGTWTWSGTKGWGSEWNWPALDALPTHDWLLGLRSLVEAATTRVCDYKWHHYAETAQTVITPLCPRCDCSDRGTITSPASPMKRLALACAWAALNSRKSPESPAWEDCSAALTAAQAHLDHPTTAGERECGTCHYWGYGSDCPECGNAGKVTTPDMLAEWWAAVTTGCSPHGMWDCFACRGTGKIRHLPLWVPTPDSDPVKDMEACSAMVDVRVACKEGVKGWTE